MKNNETEEKFTIQGCMSAEQCRRIKNKNLECCEGDLCNKGELNNVQLCDWLRNAPSNTG